MKGVESDTECGKRGGGFGLLGVKVTGKIDRSHTNDTISC